MPKNEASPGLVVKRVKVKGVEHIKSLKVMKDIKSLKVMKDIKSIKSIKKEEGAAPANVRLYGFSKEVKHEDEDNDVEDEDDDEDEDEEDEDEEDDDDEEDEDEDKDYKFSFSHFNIKAIIHNNPTIVSVSFPFGVGGNEIKIPIKGKPVTPLEAIQFTIKWLSKKKRWEDLGDHDWLDGADEKRKGNLSLWLGS